MSIEGLSFKKSKTVPLSIHSVMIDGAESGSRMKPNKGRMLECSSFDQTLSSLVSFFWAGLINVEAFYLYSRLTRAKLGSVWMLKRSLFTAIRICDPFRCKIPMYISEQPPHLRKRKELRSTK